MANSKKKRNVCSSLCAFAINDDGDDTLYSTLPFSIFSQNFLIVRLQRHDSEHACVIIIIIIIIIFFAMRYKVMCSYDNT